MLVSECVYVCLYLCAHVYLCSEWVCIDLISFSNPSFHLHSHTHTHTHVGDKMTILADGDCTFAKLVGLTVETAAFGMFMCMCVYVYIYIYVCVCVEKAF